MYVCVCIILYYTYMQINFGRASDIKSNYIYIEKKTVEQQIMQPL